MVDVLHWFSVTQDIFFGVGSVFESLGMRVNGFRMTWKVMGLSQLIFLILSPFQAPSMIIYPSSLSSGFYGHSCLCKILLLLSM